MPRIRLICWKVAEAEPRLTMLRAIGYHPEYDPDQSGPALRSTRVNPPDAFIIDLDRTPSHGRAVGVFLRQQKATRRIPIIFVGGAGEALQKTKDLLPDALYTRWKGMADVLDSALSRPPSEVMVPKTMDEYAERSLPGKLGIRPGAAVALIGAPPGIESKLMPLPEGAQLRRHRAIPAAELTLLFVRCEADLSRYRPALNEDRLERVWVLWPKKASGAITDLSLIRLRQIARQQGLIDYRICFFDEDWAAVLLGKSKKDRRTNPPA